MKSGVSFEWMNAAASPAGRAVGRRPSSASRADAAAVGQRGGGATITTSPLRPGPPALRSRSRHEPDARDALVDHEDRRHLSAADDGPRERQRAPWRAAETRAAERPGSKARRVGQRDLDEKRAGIGVHRAADFIDRSAVAGRRPGPSRARRGRGAGGEFVRCATRPRGRRAGSRACPPGASGACPGAAMLPGSTIFSVTTPSNGAVMRANDSVVARRLAGGAGAFDAGRGLFARAAAPAARASARAARPWPHRAPAPWPSVSRAGRRFVRGSHAPARGRHRRPVARPPPPRRPVRRPPRPRCAARAPAARSRRRARSASGPRARDRPATRGPRDRREDARRQRGGRARLTTPPASNVVSDVGHRDRRRRDGDRRLPRRWVRRRPGAASSRPGRLVERLTATAAPVT